VWSGPTEDTHLQGPPLFQASSEGVPFRFALHPGDSELGNTMILGPSRSGKSALLGFMMSQFWRYAGTQVFCFDKDYALYAATILGGGTHYDLGGETSFGLQPLRHIDTSESERRWAHQWLQHLITAQGVTVTPEDREQLWIALGHLAGFPSTMRTLSTYGQLLQVHRLKAALTPFLDGGPHAFLDAAEDTLAFAAWTTLEMRKLLDMPAARPHVLRIIFHRMSARFDGRPTLIVIDEAHKLLADATFGPEILDFLKERAKLNVSVILCTQEVADFSTSPAAQAIFASCRSFVYLPNRAATNPPVATFYRQCGLSDEQTQLLAMSTPKRDYLYKSDVGLRRFQLVLSPLERLLVAASTPAEIRALRALVASQPAEPLAAAWLRTNGYAQEADIFVTDYHEKGHIHDTDMPLDWLTHLCAGAAWLQPARAAYTGTTGATRAGA
jgi:type IV secretory pathway VirB4 component